MKLWGGRFTKQTNELVDEYTASISFDQKLAKYDILGSLAHVEMLEKCNILSTEESNQVKVGLKTVWKKILGNEVNFSIQDEDIHMNIEKLLIDEIGPLGGKLHTARSRNDQVALDMRLYLRDNIITLIENIINVQKALIKQATDNIDTILPGYTHLQRAQPVRFAHHLMAYVFMFNRDIERLKDSFKRVNVSPLGAGALAGTTFSIDRHFVAEQLQFDGVTNNSLDAVSDRDFVVEFLSNASLIMMHLSRLCEELIFWSSAEFQFVELDDAFCTGSSMMPQKKNPDVAELVRGKTGRVYGHLIGLLTTLKGLPLAYNKDMQEDKEGMFDTVDTMQGALMLFAPMIETMKVRKEKMYNAVKQDFSNATDLADYLVSKDIPFREAHTIVGKIVLYCIENEKYLLQLSIEEFQQFTPMIEEDIFEVLHPHAVVDARDVYGGTAKQRVFEQLHAAQSLVKEHMEWMDNNQKHDILQQIFGS